MRGRGSCESLTARWLTSGVQTDSLLDNMTVTNIVLCSPIPIPIPIHCQHRVITPTPRTEDAGCGELIKSSVHPC